MPPDRERDQLRGDRRAHRPVPGLGTDIVRRLVDDGLVLDSGPAVSTAGIRRRMLEFNENARYVIGVLLDADPILYMITNRAGTVLRHDSLSARLTDPTATDRLDKTAGNRAVRQRATREEHPATVNARIAETGQLLAAAAGARVDAPRSARHLDPHRR